ncbi:transmembrane anterior posterior transformation protein 1 homolog isoform X2 [Watersipora subatra]|uniref:transmembrane anterior posterior transformation protein 1 homolog isoform X2 n=1 Tax=Watersipora subatra TaxID=2589382 RepID=UPI00355C9448
MDESANQAEYVVEASDNTTTLTAVGEPDDLHRSLRQRKDYTNDNVPFVTGMPQFCDGSDNSSRETSERSTLKSSGSLVRDSVTSNQHTGDFKADISAKSTARDLDFTDTIPSTADATLDSPIEEKPSGFASYLWSELSRGYEPDENEAVYNVKRERVSAFLRIPKECEKFMLYGFLQCVDSFLFIFTFLPLRLMVVILRLISRPWTLCMPYCYLSASQRCDIVKGILIAMACLLMHYVDASRVYHVIRGQATIKLYILFNLLEVGDRLLSSFGQDILDALMWTVADSKRQSHGILLLHLVTGVVYVFLHSMLVLLQASALNVAFNSHQKALLTILISNNAVELKGSVFKKFEKTNLFQMSCSDVRERFHMQILIFIVCVRNMTDFAWDIEKFLELIPDILVFTLSEVVVDATKHAFITKFNNIPSAVYHEYTVLLANDVITSRKKNAFSDVSDQVSRRLGLIPLPLACLLIKIVSQCFKIHSPLALVNTILGFLCLFGAKLVIGVLVYGWAVDYCNDYRDEQTKLSKRQRHKSCIDKDLLKCENNYHWHKKPAYNPAPSPMTGT